MSNYFHFGNGSNCPKHVQKVGILRGEKRDIWYLMRCVLRIWKCPKKYTKDVQDFADKSNGEYLTTRPVTNLIIN